MTPIRKALVWLFALHVASCGGHALDLGAASGNDLSPEGGPGLPTRDVVLPSWPVTGQRNPRSLRSVGPYLYWIAEFDGGGGVRRCEKRDCANTVTVVWKSTVPAASAIEIHGDTLYVIRPVPAISPFDSTSIAWCRLSSCDKLISLIEDAEPAAVAFDDETIYWSSRTDRRIYACPLVGCRRKTTLPRFYGADAIELAVDGSSLYWIAAGPELPYIAASLMVAKKDGSEAPKPLAEEQNQASSLAIRDGVVSWATTFTLGAIARCPVSGCPAAGPEALTTPQYFPRFVHHTADNVWWMNGILSFMSPQSVQIMGCDAANCAATVAVLDQGSGGGSSTRSMKYPTREMVADDDAIYWVGDIVNAGRTMDGFVALDGSIRRTALRRSW